MNFDDEIVELNIKYNLGSEQIFIENLGDNLGKKKMQEIYRKIKEALTG